MPKPKLPKPAVESAKPKKDEDEIDPEQARKDMERLELIKQRREEDRLRRIKEEGWDRFAPVTETNKKPDLTPKGYPGQAGVTE